MSGWFPKLLGFAFLASCAIAVVTIGVGPGPLEWDADQYWTMGRDIAAGDWFQLHNEIDYRGPLYPTLLGAFQSLFRDKALLAVVISQHVLILLTHILLAFVCWRMTGSKVAALVAYALAVSSLMRPWFANVICTEPLFMFLFTATVTVLCLYHQGPSLRWAIAFGLLMGLTMLVRPVPKLLWFPLVGLFFCHSMSWAARRIPPRRIFEHAVAATFVVMLILAPWYARNWAVFGEPFLARLPAVNKWEVCFQGGSAARLRMPRTESGERVLQLIGTRDGDVAQRYCYAAVGALEKQGLSKQEVDELVTQVCLEAVRAQPLDFAWPTFKRFVNFWRCTPNGIPYYDIPHRSEYYGQYVWDFGSVAEGYRNILRRTPVHWLRWTECWTFVFGLGSIAMLLERRTRLAGASLLMVFGYFAAVTAAVEVENYKYRMILEPCMIVAAVCGGTVAIDLNRRIKRRGSVSQSQIETVPYGIPMRKVLSQSGVIDRDADQKSESGAASLAVVDATKKEPVPGELEELRLPIGDQK